MPATGTIKVAPGAAAGALIAIGGSAWTFGSYVTLTTGLGTDIYLEALTFTPEATTFPFPALGAAYQVLIEVATGAAASEVLLAQIPWTLWPVSAVEYNQRYTFPFLTPLFVAASTRISARVAASIATSSFFVSGVKLMYREP